MNTSLQTLDMSLPIGSLDAYILRVNQIPMLTEEEEKELTNRLYYQNDLEAARRLVMSHLRFVVSVARGYSGYGLQQSDLIQEGNIGLMKAVKRFNPEMGVRLVSYAIHWVKAEMHEFILRNWRIVKVATTKAQRKLFFNLRKATKSLGHWLTNKEAENIAQKLKVPLKEVRNMEQRLRAHHESFDTVATSDDDTTSWNSPVHYLEDNRNDPARLVEENDSESARKQGLMNALKSLDPRSQDILQKRWLAEEKTTLHELAAIYNVSAERIRQLESNAMKKIKESLAE